MPIPDVEYKIDKPNENGVGEIIVKGPNVMLGYFENVEATNKVLINGWFHTGDLGYIDDEEFLYISGRCKNMILTKNGENIYPEEIESILAKTRPVRPQHRPSADRLRMHGSRRHDDAYPAERT